MEPEVDPGECDDLIVRVLQADFDLEAVKNPTLTALLSRLKSEAPVAVRGFNNFIS